MSPAPAKEIRVDAAGAAAALSELVGIRPFRATNSEAGRFFSACHVFSFLLDSKLVLATV